MIEYGSSRFSIDEEDSHEMDEEQASGEVRLLVTQVVESIGLIKYLIGVQGGLRLEPSRNSRGNSAVQLARVVLLRSRWSTSQSSQFPPHQNSTIDKRTGQPDAFRGLHTEVLVPFPSQDLLEAERDLVQALPEVQRETPTRHR